MTRKLERLILQRAAAIKNSVIAEALHKDESTACRIVSGEIGVKIGDIPALLDALGLKVVDSGAVQVDIAVLESLRTLAAKALSADAGVLIDGD